MACPMVASLAALMLSADSTLSPNDVLNCLHSSADNIDALDQRDQITREAPNQTLTQPTAPEQRSDNSGDMFALEKAQAEIDKRNAGVESQKDPNQPGMFDAPETAPVAKEASMASHR